MSHEFEFQYGQGWFVGEFGGAENARWHLGNLPYFTAWMVLLPESNQAAVVLINAGSQFEIAGGNEVMSRIPRGIVSILRGAEAPTGVGISTFFIIFDAAVLMIVALQVWSLVRVASRSARIPHGVLGWTRTLAPLSWELGIGVLILLAAPVLLGATWSQSFKSIPDMTLVLLAVSILWLTTGLTRAGRHLLAITHARSAQSAERPASAILSVHE
jgi:hypothetical protein